VEHNNDPAAAAASVDHAAHAGLLDDLMARIAPCFARRETRLTCRDMINGLLSELEDHNCWTLAEAAGHASPYRMQHLLSRARVEEDHQLAKQVSGLDSGQVTTWTSWHRWTAISLLACAYLAVAAAWQRAADSSAGVPELIPVTIPELLRQLRGTVIPDPRRDRDHRDAWTGWRRHHQYGAQRARQRWHAYADEIPQAR
jgi:hypothetical protein